VAFQSVNGGAGQLAGAGGCLARAVERRENAGYGGPAVGGHAVRERLLGCRSIAGNRGLFVRLQWINHASFLLTTGETRLLVDPWFDGRAFNDSWALTSPTVISDDDLRSVTDLWISHEHPDHFSPPTLKRFPTDLRQRVRVYYQQSSDKRVVGALGKLGFRNVRELGAAPVSLAPEVDLLAPPFMHGDSWMLLRTPEAAFLNLNDCNTDAASLARIAARCGTIDVLMTQFSYASWAGNRRDLRAHEQAAAGVVRRLLQQCEILKPRFVVLGASYVWFCHPDNVHMNAAANRVGDVARTIAATTEVRPIVLYPGETWDVGAPHDFAPAAEKYASDAAACVERPALTSERHVGEAELSSHGNAFVRQLLKYNRTTRLLLLEPTRIYVTDLQKTFSLSPLRGFTEVGTGGPPADVELSSDALDYAFRFGWGGETLLVSGRYEVPPGGDFKRFYKYFDIAMTNARGHRYPNVVQVGRTHLAGLLPPATRSAVRGALAGLRRRSA
jgi:hypothetical protein